MEQQGYEQDEREAMQQEPDVADVKKAESVGKKPKHRATYATDKRNGGYLIRVAGPYPEKFVGREIPVDTRGGETHMEKLVALVWAGTDQETGGRVALYKFEKKERTDNNIEW
jgi:hypothetical protein